MGEWSANNQVRAKAVWDKLLGFFGDALLRKFDAEPPEEWIEAVGMLNDAQISTGMKRMMLSWKGGPPNLPDFVRLCRVVGPDERAPLTADCFSKTSEERAMRRLEEQRVNDPSGWLKTMADHDPNCFALQLANKHGTDGVWYDIPNRIWRAVA